MQSSLEEHVKLAVRGCLQERDNFKCNENVSAENYKYIGQNQSIILNSITVIVSKGEPP